MIINWPTSQKIIGGNIVAKQSYGTGMAYGDAWTNLWIDWDWDNWIKPQIDYLTGNDVGCNCIRLLGTLNGVFKGAINQGSYNLKWTQLAAYCLNLKVGLYFCGGWCPQVSAASASYNAGSPTMTDQDIADAVRLPLNALTGYIQSGVVIGCDIMQEQDGWGLVCGEANPVTRSINIYNKLKAFAWGFPPGAANQTPIFTYSCSGNWNDSTFTRPWIASMSPAMDYIDFHFYTVIGPNYDPYNPIALSDFNYWRSTYPDLDILCGEFGQQQTQNYDQQASFFNSILTGFTQGDIKVRGALQWGATDGNNVASDMWGTYDVGFADTRVAKKRVVRQFTGGNVASRR